MPKLILFLMSFSSLISLGILTKPTLAYEESSGEAYKCDLTVETSSAPGIIDKIFLDTTTSPLPTQEAFKLIAHLTDKSKSHMFERSKSPYKATIAYGYNTATSLPYEDELGEMKLVRSIPNTDEEDLDEDDTKECTKYKTIRGEEECVEYAEDQDPGDLINSWNSEGENFKFGSLGLVSLRVYQNDNKTPTNLNTRVCLKDISVVQSYQLTVSVAQPLKPGDKVIISGQVLDHAKAVEDAKVYITIGTKTVSTSTNEDGEYSYDSDTTQTWGIAQDNTKYIVEAKTNVDSKEIKASSEFGVNITPPESTGEKVVGVNPRIQLCRYYNSNVADHWSTTALQIPGPSTDQYSQETCLGDLNTEDDGEGPLIPLYDCLEGSDHFNSVYQPNCPKYSRVGYIYNSNSNRPSGTHPLYLCKHTTTGERKTTLSSDCKNSPDEESLYTLESVLGYVLEPGECLPKEGVTTEVKGPSNLDIHQYFAERVGQLTIAPEVVKETVNNSENSLITDIGVAESFLPKSIGCINLLGLIQIGYCTSSVTLNRNTNQFVNLLNMFNSSIIYPGLIRETPKGPADDPSDPEVEMVLSDIGSTCQGNTKIGQATDYAGDSRGNNYTTEFPSTITIPSLDPTTGETTETAITIPLIGTLNPNAPLTAASQEIKEDTRTKEFDCSVDLYMRGTYPDFYRPLKFENIPCPQATPIPIQP